MSGRVVTLEWPWPEKRLWPNRRAHWRELHAARQQSRLVARAGAMHVLRPGETIENYIPLTLEFCPPANRRFDRDNALAALKGHLDGLAEALRVDDTLFEPITLRRGPVIRGGCVRVQIGE